MKAGDKLFRGKSSHTSRLTASAVLLAGLSVGAQNLSAQPAINSEFMQHAQADIAAREYLPHEFEKRVVLNNRKLGMRGVFAAEGLQLADRETGESTLKLKLESFGRASNKVLVNQQQAKIRNARVELDRGNVQEWFINTPAGIEQGFDIDSKPGGAGELLLHIDTDHAVLSLAEDGVSLDLGEQQLSYNKLKAWDAKGTILPSSMRIESDDIVLSIDDSQAVYPIVVDPLLSSVVDGTLVSSQNSAFFGHDAANVGDVNGDGFQDIVVTAYGFDGSVGANEGGWFLYLGGETINITTDGSGLGQQIDARMGSSVAGVGDVNSDGYDDFIVGAEFFDIGGAASDEGQAYLYYGGATFNSVADKIFLGTQVAGNFGSGVAGADLNGDGYSDLAIAAKNFDDSAVDSGSVFVYLGASNMDVNVDATLSLNVAGVRFGTGLDSAGDVNADGFDDLIVGAPEFESVNTETNEGQAVLYLGGATFNTVGDASYQVNQSEARMGESVAGAGDMNGDGFADLLIGARLYDPGITNAGGAFVYFGALSPPVSPTPDLSYSVAQNTAHLGASVAAAGDVNADGYADVLVGAPLFDGGSTDEGAAYVYLGAASPLSTPFYRRLEVNQGNAQSGTALAGGDFNGDGYSDVLAGGPLIDGAATDGGRVEVFFGGALLPDATREANISSNQGSAQLGRAVATGDVNGDGFADLVTGESGYDNGANTNAGRIQIFFGAQGGFFNGSADDVILGGGTGWRLGSSVAVGDLNGDGYADILAGAPEYSNGENLEGSAQIFYASSTGLFPTTANVTIEANLADTLLGSSVAIAGDIEGDGDSDIVVGAPGFDAGLIDQGLIAVYLNKNGFGNDPSLVAGGGQAGAEFGGAVSSAGDVNGDGLADLMAGASGFDSSGASNAGLIRVYYGSAVPNLTADYTKEAGNVSMRFGSCLAHTDLNGDGFSDIFVGAPEYSDGIFNQTGAGFLYEGSASGVSSIPLVRVQMGFSQAEARFGSSCHGLGDVNGDGLGDLVIGAPRFDTTLTDAGAGFLYLGSSPFTNSAPLVYEAGLTALAFAGSSVTGADFNGDGYSDLAIGAEAEDNGATLDTGKVSIYFGNGAGRRVAPRTVEPVPTGLRTIDSWGNANSANRITINSFPYASGKTCTRAKLQVQACRAGLAFGDAACVDAQTTSWAPLVAQTRLELTLPVSVDLHHWRARLLYRDCAVINDPVAPRKGPWRRMHANANLSDVRTTENLFRNGFE